MKRLGAALAVSVAVALAAVVLLCGAGPPPDKGGVGALPHHVLACTVMVKAPVPGGPSAYGSGVAVRNGADTFVWTAAHVVSPAGPPKKIIFPDGATRLVVRFPDVVLVQEVVEQGRKVGEASRLAEVVRHSPSNDLAVLRLRSRGWPRGTCRFRAGDLPPAPGSRHWHGGALGGPVGLGSLTELVMSGAGRLRVGDHHDEEGVGGPPVPFDQFSGVFMGGSSGGGVFCQRTGECVGLASQYMAAGAHGSLLVVPARRLRRWAAEADCLWALGPGRPVPPDFAPVFRDPVEVAD